MPDCRVNAEKSPRHLVRTAAHVPVKRRPKMEVRGYRDPRGAVPRDDPGGSGGLDDRP